MAKIGVLCSRVRIEEKMLLTALRERGVDYERVDPRGLALDLRGNGWDAYDAVLVRCLSHSRAYYVTRWLDHVGVPAISSHQTVANCGDKLLTNAVLQEAEELILVGCHGQGPRRSVWLSR